MRRHPEFGPKFGIRNEAKKSKKELEKIEFRQETENKMEEAVRKYGLSTENWPKEYIKYLKRYRRRIYEWGYDRESYYQWLREKGFKVPLENYYPGDYHAWLEMKGFKLPLNEELIQKMREAIASLGTDSAVIIDKSKYRNDYVKIGTHPELGYKNWEDFLARGLIPSEIKDELFEEKYEDLKRESAEELIVALPKEKMEAIADKFLEENYPKRKDRVKERVIEVMKNWQEGLREKLRKEKRTLY